MSSSQISRHNNSSFRQICFQENVDRLINLHTRWQKLFEKLVRFALFRGANSFQSKMSKEHQLCARDLSVLNLLFDSSLVENKAQDLTQLSAVDDVDVKDEDEGSSADLIASKQLELEGVRSTEAGKFEEALLKFNEALVIAANRPSIYNNRAQLYRFLQKDDRKKVHSPRILKRLKTFSSSGTCRPFKSNRTIDNRSSSNKMSSILSTRYHQEEAERREWGSRRLQ